MFDNVNLGPEVLANPSTVQSMILQEFQNRLNGTVSVADPNNAFCFILEAGSSITAQAVRSAEKQFETLYPVRATTAAELYPHMSDFDYLAMTASPATCSFRLVLDSDWLTTNAISYDTNYDMVVIPDSSVITMGGRSFQLYYPIQIMINRTTGTILATWDLSVPNPLYTQDSNFLTDVTMYSQAGLNLIALTFNTYQFSKSSTTDVATPQMGFNKIYNYTDQFYAARVYSLLNNVWVELTYTLSQVIYDTATPTVILSIFSDTNSLQVQIPQVYFTNNQIGNQIKVDIYTTQGALNVSIAQSDAQSVTANFDITSSPYAVILAQPPTLLLIPYNQTQIVGGSNGMNFAQIRQAVIDNSLYSQVPITPLQLTAQAAKLGFTLTKYLDNITDRIYFASSTMVNAANQMIVPLGMLATIFDFTAISNTTTILSYTDNLTTILPTTIFQFNAVSNTCVPLTTAQIQYLASLTSTALAATLNNTIYTRQPYHLVIYSSATYPSAKSFDLTNPTTTGLQFITENASSSVQLTVASLAITHLQSGTGGFQLTIGIKRSISLQSADPNSFYVVITVQDRQGDTLQLRAVYQTTTTLLDVYTVLIPTDYHITQDLFIRTTLNNTTGIPVLVEIPLAASFNIILGVSHALNPTVSSSVNLQTQVPTVYPDMLAVSQQSVTVTFGIDLSASIFNIVTSVWGAQQYQTYPENVYYTYPHDEYAVNQNGVLTTQITVDSTGENIVQLTKLHNKGDQVLVNGAPLIQYPAGSITLDSNGLPIPITNRSVVYTVQMLQLDAKLFSSNNPIDNTYIGNFTGLLLSNITALSPLVNQLLERTALYYKPSRTLGLATYGIGNGKTVQLPLGLSFSFVYYVPSVVLNDLTQQAILLYTTQQIIAQAVTQPIISLTTIADTLISSFGSKVTAIDIEGINGNPVLQTLALLDTDAISSVGLNLVVAADGTLSIQPAITIQYSLTPVV